jgi:flavin-dependent dehydrogenase
VVIVGAGPAGLMTAKTASESGLKILLLDRKTDISKVHRTDGGVICINEYLFGEVAHFNRKTQNFVFPVNGFSLHYSGPWSDAMYGFHIYSPGGKRFMIGDWKELRKDPEKYSKGINLSKGSLLEGILNDARKNGVDFMANANVTAVKSTDNGALVTAGNDTYEGRFVIAADGINSRIARLMGLNKDRRFVGTWCNQIWTLEGINIADSEGMIFVITMYGMFAVMPLAQKGRFHVGASTNKPNVDLSARLKQFTSKDPVYSPWFKNAKKIDEEGESCVANIWEALEKPYKDHVVFVGDSFWIQEFSNVASLCAGHKLGHSLIKAFHDKQFDEEGLAPYFDWYSKYCFEPHGRRELGAGGSLWDYLTAEELDYLSALPPESAPPSLSFFGMFKTIMNTYMELFLKISEEKPDILTKLRKMRENAAEDKTRVKKAGFPNK